ncbi:MAG: MBL fold metallo-hydrolase [Phycisphaeraceae bacterium]|nr:MBL fold metallo-hydrolase [Phycisphaeraceae bacterium]
MNHGSSKDAPASPSRRGGPLLETVTLGPFETNCYIVADGDRCWIIDASFEPEALIERVRDLGLKPEALILTHAHVDHIAGVDEVVRTFGPLPVVMHADEREWLANPMLNLSAAMGLPVTACGPDRFIAEGDRLTLGGQTWKVLHTPGHSPGGVSLVNSEAGIALVGDTLFAGSIGRTDFPGSDFESLAHSIRAKLYTLPDDTRVYPGHGPPTTIGREKRTNPFVLP